MPRNPLKTSPRDPPGFSSIKVDNCAKKGEDLRRFHFWVSRPTAPCQNDGNLAKLLIFTFFEKMPRNPLQTSPRAPQGCSSIKVDGCAKSCEDLSRSDFGVSRPYRALPKCWKLGNIVIFTFYEKNAPKPPQNQPSPPPGVF